MCKKKLYLTCFGLLASLVVTNKAVADPGLVGWWKFDETSGTIAADSSGNGNNGTVINDPNWISGKINGAVELDGADATVFRVPRVDPIGNKTKCDHPQQRPDHIWHHHQVGLGKVKSEHIDHVDHPHGQHQQMPAEHPLDEHQDEGADLE